MRLLPLYITASLLLAETAMAADPYTTTGVVTGSLRVVGALVLVIGLMLLIYALAKKRFSFLPGQRQGTIKVIEMRHLAPKKSVALIEVRGRELLVGVGQENLSLLCELDKTDSFEQTLQEQLEERP